MTKIKINVDAIVASAVKNLNAVDRSIKVMDKGLRGASSTVRSVTSSFSSLQSNGVRALRSINSEMSRTVSQAKSMGGTLTKSLTLPILGAGGLGIKVGLDFEQSVNDLKSVLLDVSDADMSQLVKQAKDLGRDTRYTARDVVLAQEKLAMTGWSKDDILNGANSSLNLASANKGVTIERAADVMSNTVAAMGYDPRQAEKVADILSLTTSRTNTDLEMLADTLKYVLPISKEFGMSLEQTSAMAGKMGDIGIQGSMAGTSMRMALTRLAAPNKMVREGLKQLGVSTVDSMGNMKDMGALLGELETKMEGLSQAQKIDISKKLFGQEALSAMMGVIGQGSGAYNKLVTELENGAGAAQKKALIREKGVLGQWREVESKLEDIGITVTEMMTPHLLKAIKMVEVLANKFIALSVEGKKLAIGVAVVVASIGPLIGVMALVAGVIGTLLTPIGLLISGLGFIVASLVTTALTSEKFRESLTSLFKSLSGSVVKNSGNIEKAFKKLLHLMEVISFGVLRGITSLVTKGISLWKNHGDTIVETLKESTKIVKKFINEGLNVLLTMTIKVLTTASSFWSKYGSTIINVLSEVLSVIKTFLGVGLTLLLEITKFVIEAVIEFWKEYGSSVKGVLNGIVEFIQGTFIPIFSTLFLVIGEVIKLVSNLWNEHKDSVIRILTTLFEVIKTIVKTAMPFIQDIIGNALGFLDRIIGERQSTWISIFKAIVTGIGTVLSDLVSLIISIIEPVLNWLLDAWDRNGNSIIEIVSNTYNMIKEYLTQVFTELYEVVIKPVLDALKELWNTHGDSIIETVKNIGNLLWTIWNDSLSGIFEIVGFVLTGIINWFNENGTEILALVNFLTNGILMAWNVLSAVLLPVIKFLFEMLGSIIKSIMDVILGNFKFYTALFKGDWEGMGEAFIQIIKGAFWTILNFFAGGIFAKIGAVLKIGLNGVAKIFGFGLDDMLRGLGTWGDNIGKYFTSIWDNIAGVFSNGIQWAIKSINKGITAINKLPGINIKNIPTISNKATDVIANTAMTTGIQKSYDGITNGNNKGATYGNYDSVYSNKAIIENKSGTSNRQSGVSNGGFTTANLILQVDKRELGRVTGVALKESATYRGGLTN